MAVSPESNLQNLLAEFAACPLKQFLEQPLTVSQLVGTTAVDPVPIPEPDSLSSIREEVEAKVAKAL
jgi:hypothetical protein